MLDATAAGGGQRFLRWWGRELAWFVPDALKYRGLPAARLLWLDVSGEVIVMRRFRQGQLVEVGRLATPANDPAAERLAFERLHAEQGRMPVGLGVGVGQVLRRAVAMPVAARDDLDTALRFEMDRQTPFRIDEVYPTYRLQGIRDGQLALDVAVLPKDAVLPWMKRLEEWGLAPHAIASLDQLTSGRDYDNFLPARLRPAASPAWRWLYAAMAILSLVLVGVILALPIWQKRETAMALMPMMAKAERDAKTAAALKDKAGAALAWHNFLIEKRLATPTTVAVIDEITRLVPDHTWIESMEIRGAEVTLQGESGASAGLVNVFAKSSLLGDANHKAPLVKIHDNRERFRLALAILPMRTSSGELPEDGRAGQTDASRKTAGSRSGP